jgi:hypothetical protein
MVLTKTVSHEAKRGTNTRTNKNTGQLWAWVVTPYSPVPQRVLVLRCLSSTVFWEVLGSNIGRKIDYSERRSSCSPLQSFQENSGIGPQQLYFSLSFSVLDYLTTFVNSSECVALKG